MVFDPGHINFYVIPGTDWTFLSNFIFIIIIEIPEPEDSAAIFDLF